MNAMKGAAAWCAYGGVLSRAQGNMKNLCNDVTKVLWFSSKSAQSFHTSAYIQKVANLVMQ